MAAEKPKKARGKPSKFTEELAEQILARLSDGEPLAQIIRSDGMPGLTTWYDWCSARPELSERFGRARDAGFDMIAMDALRIADTPELGTITKLKDGAKEITQEDMLGHRKLQVETRLKLLAKWDPRRYGDKIALGGATDLPPVQTNTQVTLDPSEAYKALLGG